MSEEMKIVNLSWVKLSVAVIVFVFGLGSLYAVSQIKLNSLEDNKLDKNTYCLDRQRDSLNDYYFHRDVLKDLDTIKNFLKHK